MTVRTHPTAITAGKANSQETPPSHQINDGLQSSDNLIHHSNLFQGKTLSLKFILFNLAGLALVIAIGMQGWLQTILAADGTGLTLVIIGTFLTGLTYCSYKVWRVSQELRCVNSFDPCEDSWATEYLEAVSGRQSGSRAITSSAFRLQIGGWIAPVRHFANSLVLLGLVGTVIGFVIALSGVDSEAISDVTQISSIVSTLLSGMSVALYTTLAGAVLNLWLMVNFHMLSAGAQELLVNLVALGEKNARV